MSDRRLLGFVFVKPDNSYNVEGMSLSYAECGDEFALSRPVLKKIGSSKAGSVIRLKGHVMDTEDLPPYAIPQYCVVTDHNLDYDYDDDDINQAIEPYIATINQIVTNHEYK